MELLRFGEKGLFSSPPRRKKWLLLIAISGVAVSGYGAYKVYHLPSVTRKRQRLAKILGAFLSVAELISESAETMTIVSRDLKEFLTSDSDEIPNSFRQIAKIANSREFTDSLSRVSRAVTIGVSRGYKSESCVDSSSEGSSVIDKVFSKAGSGFFSVVVGSFAKNLVLGFRAKEVGDSSSEEPPQWLSLLCDDKCRVLLAECIERFTSTAVAVYLDKTMDINAFDQIFEGMTNPKHQDSVKDVLVSVCNSAIETVVRTSHEVFTTPKSSAAVIQEVEEEEESNGGGWTDAISTTLAVPSNRRFMFDVTGRVTLETTRSFIGFLMMKTLQGFRRSFDVVQEGVTERGRQVVGYVGAKASVIVTVWLALYLHIINRCARNSPIGVSQHF
ncbi:Protein PHLOEM PROTEIN 2-LIKE A10 [Raphanus sativus]|uniref:Protein PHLOEM PROTEIN 2-LIKE A10 n=1 Tax=Raphanus sativus TaxID=3726 RepID=A0A6J0JG27_RAPSA|nr:protein PHLOEM PROTEIN 2-LIKE A10 [Raphanus sativus]KAJ4879104.1 Protein PHLOEM PROTEIN 2-LIKE A10 [Raphanus sativus]